MKRAFLFIVALSCAGFILAQDIVVTKAGTTIEDVTVVSVTADNVVYKQGDSINTLSSSEVEGVLYSDGRYITPPSIQTLQIAEDTATVDESWATDNALKENTKAVPQTKTQADNHVVFYYVLFMNKSYSTECRKEGKRVFKETYVMEEQKIKQARKSMTREERNVINNEIYIKAMNASNDAVLECSGLKDNNTHTQPDNESGQ